MRVIDRWLLSWRQWRSERAARQRQVLAARARRRVASARQRDRRRQALLARVWAATDGPFVVADLETTGLRVGRAEILEIAAVRVSAEGRVLARFQALVRLRGPLPAEITRLTGITARDVRERGRPLPEVLDAFLAFVADHPVLCHNAGFDRRFLAHAAESLGVLQAARAEAEARTLEEARAA